MQEGCLFAIIDGQSIFTPAGQSVYSDAALSKLLAGTATATSFAALAESLEVTWCKKKGVVLAGGVRAVACLRPFKHLTRSTDGSIKKVFSKAAAECVLCPVQLLMTDLERVDERWCERESLSVAELCSSPDRTVMYVGKRPQFYGRIGRVERAAEDGRAVRVTLMPIPDVARLAAACRPELAKAATAADQQFLDSKSAAAAASIPPWLLSKLASTMQVIPGPNANSHPINLGLSVKFEGKSLAAPGLARRVGPGEWQYSRQLIRLVKEYRHACPKLFDGLIRVGPRADRPTAAALGMSPAEVQSARAWLKEHVRVPALRPCHGVSFIDDSTCLTTLARTLDALHMATLLKKETDESSTIVASPAELITRHDSVAFLNSTTGKFDIGDIVVWCGDGADGLPFGEVGLVVGVFGTDELWVLLAAERKGVAEKHFPGGIGVGSWRAWAGVSQKWMKMKSVATADEAKSSAAKPVVVKKTLPFTAAIEGKQPATATAAAAIVAKSRGSEEGSVDLLTRLFAAASIEQQKSSANATTAKQSESSSKQSSSKQAKDSSAKQVESSSKQAKGSSKQSTSKQAEVSSKQVEVSSKQGSHDNPVKQSTSSTGTTAAAAAVSNVASTSPSPAKKFTIKKRTTQP